MGRRLAAILAADVVGYTRLMGKDETGTLERLTALREKVLAPLVAQYNGRIVKLMGDGLLVEFASVVDALTCAIAWQKDVLEREAETDEDKRFQFRIGINLGDIIIEGDDIHGDGVNVATRLEGLADVGGICLSGDAYRQVRGKVDATFEDLGERAVKNVAEPLRIYRTSISHPPSAAMLAGTSPRAPLDKPSIAVLPFDNMSGDPEQEYFSDGITEDIITDLSKISGLHVIARNSVFTYKGKPADVQEVSRRFGVNTVLEGSVRKAGQRVRISAQLVSGKDGGHLWADRYDRDLTDIFAIQDEITRTIVYQLKVKLLPEESKAISQTPTDNVEAYTYYLRGRQFSHGWTKSYLLLARRMFSKAAELDPNYARAYAGIADCDSALHAWRAAEVSMDGVMEMSAKALSLDPDLAEAHASRGTALHESGRHDEAIAEFERALALDPNLYEANFFYARFFLDRGDFEKAAKFLECAAEIRSDDYLSPVLLVSACRSLGRHTDRMRWARLTVERAERALNLHPENSGPAHRGAIALAHLGERDRAQDWADRALAIDPDDTVAHYNVACMHSILGNIELAIDLLERVLPLSSSTQLDWFKNDSDLEPIRNHPRFQKLLDTIKRV
jgi:adenylate cyclase